MVHHTMEHCICKKKKKALCTTIEWSLKKSVLVIDNNLLKARCICVKRERDIQTYLLVYELSNY